MLVLRSAVAAINKKGGHEFGKGKEDFLGGCGEMRGGRSDILLL